MKILFTCIFTLSLAFGLTACTKKEAESTSTQAQQPSASGMLTPPGESTELKKVDVKVGTGAEAVPGKMVKVHYTGTLTNGTKFDSSVDRNSPFEFKLGSGQVIPGWEQGIQGMKVGGKRTLTIPPNLAYGDRAMGDKIPANSTLLFDVELLGVQ